MVNTRSQKARDNSISMNGINRHSDAESEDSLPDVLTREQMSEFDNGDLLNYRNDTERHAVNQRFSEINRQISELTNLVIALTEKIFSSNREGNGLNTVSYGHETRSDNETEGSTIISTTTKAPLKNTSKLSLFNFSDPSSKQQAFEVKSTPLPVLVEALCKWLNNRITIATQTLQNLNRHRALIRTLIDVIAFKDHANSMRVRIQCPQHTLEVISVSISIFEKIELQIGKVLEFFIPSLPQK